MNANQNKYHVNRPNNQNYLKIYNLVSAFIFVIGLWLTYVNKSFYSKVFCFISAIGASIYIFIQNNLLPANFYGYFRQNQQVIHQE